ncbi:MAG: hypothetical protein IJ003_07025 [Candidatus Gastranaerophilales bacterium]|nr:hypothetical protein [Candidatus Gastranaerophilales bacterium]
MTSDYSTRLGDEARCKYAANIVKTNTEDTNKAKIESDKEQLEKDQESLFTLVNDVQNGNINAIKAAQSAQIIEPTGLDAENDRLVAENGELLKKAKTEAEKKQNNQNATPPLAPTTENVNEIKKILEAQGDTDITDADIQAFLNNQM